MYTYVEHADDNNVQRHPLVTHFITSGFIIIDGSCQILAYTRM